MALGFTVSQQHEKQKRKLTQEEQQVLQYAVSDKGHNLRLWANKLVNDPHQVSQEKSRVPTELIKNISNQTISEIEDIRQILKALPEIETAKDILVSSILSPNNMINEELTYTVGDGFPAKLGQQLLTIIDTYFTDERGLNDRLADFLNNALFDRGSHILAVFPESSIDDLINSRAQISMESAHEKMKDLLDQNGQLKETGILGRGIKETYGQQDQFTYSVESFFSRGHQVKSVGARDIIPGLLKVTDNIDLLKMSTLKKRIQKDSIKNKYRPYSLESVMLDPNMGQEGDRMDDAPLPANQMYRKVTQTNQSGIAVVNDRDHSSRKSIGRPMVLDLAHEAVVPISVPGNVNNHIGYFLILDGNGNQITWHSQQGYLDDMESNFNGIQKQSNQHGTVVSNTIQELGSLISGSDCPKEFENIEVLRQWYAKVIERDLKMRLNNGIYGEEIEIPHVESLYNIMLARALAGSQTQILYIPESLVTYIAFYYNEYGIGESLITRAKNIISLRIAAIYANNKAIIDNAIGQNKLKIELDQDVQDPEERVAKIINRVIESNSDNPLFHSFDPRRIGEQMFKSGLSVIVSGNDTIDTTNVELEYNSGSKPTVDESWVDSTKKDVINAMQVIPQLFDDAEQVQFSSEFTTKNALFMKRNLIKGKKFNAFMTDFVRKETLHNGYLIEELSNAIRSGYSELNAEIIEEAKQANSTIPIIELFLDGLEVGVPLPEITTEEQETYENYEKRVSAYLEPLLSPDTMEAFIKEEDDEKRRQVIQDTMKYAKSLFLASWIRKNNAFPEFEEMFYVDGKPNPELLKSLLNMSGDAAELLGDIYNAYYQARNPDGEDESSSTDDTSMSGDGDSFGGESDSSTDDDTSTEEDDFNMDDEPDTEEPEEPEEPTEDDTGTDDTGTDDTSGDDDTSDDASGEDL